MKRPVHGPSFYYATDKNIFDALNEHKVDSETIASLFEKRNTLVSQKASREELAMHFSTLTHDYYDHREIAARLGIVSRRERVTSMDIVGIISDDNLKNAIDTVSNELQKFGDVVTTSRTEKTLTVHIQYSGIDYRKSEFNQVQVKDGFVEFQISDEGYIVRNTQNEYLNNVRETIVKKVGELSSNELQKKEVSLISWPDPKTRSNFFFDLFTTLPGYSLQDVTDIFVFKPTEGLANDASEEEVDSHVERVALKGTGVTRSDFLGELAGDGYYTVRVGWKVKDMAAQGNIYAIEAVFADPLHCTGFSYILVGVHQNNGGIISKQRRSPQKIEITEISKAIESRSRKLMEILWAANASESEEEE